MGSEFTNRLRKHLEGTAPADHPGPEALNAYIEHSLTPGEQRQVTEHLSICSDCREVVFLASQAAEDEPATPVTAQAPVHRVRWWTWALPVTAILVVAAVVLVRPTLTSKQPATMADARRMPEPPAPQDKANQQPSAAPVITTAVPVQQPPAQKSSRQTDMAPPPPPPPSAQPESKNELAKDFGYTGAPVTGRNLAPLPAAPSQAVTVQAQNEPSFDADKLQSAQKQGSEYAYNAGARDETVQVTSEAATVQTETVNGNAARADAKTLAANTAGLTARSLRKKADQSATWRVTADGRLLHSVFGNWQPALADSGAHFNVVTVLGTNVWAGANGFALYHSSDDGQTWARQNLLHDSADDIVEIRFTSPQEGVFTTRQGAGFATHDGGNSWAPMDKTSTPRN